MTSRDDQSHSGSDDPSPPGFLGVGPLLGLAALLDAAALGFIGRLTGWPLAPGETWSAAWTGLGVALLVVGAVAYAACLAYFRRQRRHGLVTTGPFARLRHPLYAIWIFLLLPGALLPLRSGLLLLTVPGNYLLARLLVPREERLLAERYGAAYDAYRERTGALLPFRWG